MKGDESKPADASSDESSKKAVKVRQNLLAMQTSARLFSNRDKTGDIKFKVGHAEIWAHKCVLAALSPKYETQFYGAGDFDDKNSDAIEVKDVTAAAFTEFLQFFYLKEIQLTHENIEHVFTLAETSLVTEFVDTCIEFLSETVSNENVCQSYYLAMKHGCEDLIETCERKISLHTDEVFASKTFIASKREVVFNILQLDSLNCKETEVFNASIAWAKNYCTETGSDPEDTKNLREALVGTTNSAVNLLHQIRFGVMTIEEFMKCYKSYKDLFTEDEREEVLYTIGKVSDIKPKRFNEVLRDVPYKKWSEDTKVECNRILAETAAANFHFGTYKTTFSLNKPILLGGFYCGCLFENANIGIDDKVLSANLTIIRKHTTQDADGNMVFNDVEQLTFGTKQQATVKLQRPIFIKPDFVYEIKLKFTEGFSVKSYEFKKEVTLNNDTTVTFHETQGLVTCLIVNLCNDLEHDKKIENKNATDFNIAAPVFSFHKK